MTRAIAIAALVGAPASIPASLLKAISEPPLQRAAESLWPADRGAEGAGRRRSVRLP
jgi:hypothetical protein